MKDDENRRSSRRTFFQTIGAASLIGIAGCLADDDDTSEADDHDDSDDVADGDDGDPTGPDLTLVSWFPDAVEVKQGNAQEFTAVVTNQGDEAGVDVLRFYGGEQELESRAVSIGPAETEDVVFEITEELTGGLEPNNYEFRVEGNEIEGTSVVTIVEAAVLGFRENPYAGIDWDTVNQTWCEIHNHSHKACDMYPHDVIDLYQREGYEMYSVNENTRPCMAWPWEELPEKLGDPDKCADLLEQFCDGEGDDLYFEDIEARDPSELEVIAIPSKELLDPEHIHIVFGTIEEYDGSSRWRLFEQIRDENGLSVLAHPGRYHTDGWQYAEETAEEFEEFAPDTLVGLTVFNKDDGWEENDPDYWDALLTKFGEEFPVWGYAEDDSEWYDIGGDVFKRRNVVLIDEADFQPATDQEASYEAGKSAFENGRLYIQEREQWDGGDWTDETATDNAPEFCDIESIDIDEQERTITIEATHYDTIEWIGPPEEIPDSADDYERNILGEGPEFAYDREDAIPWFRARIARGNQEAVTYTNPWFTYG